MPRYGALDVVAHSQVMLRLLYNVNYVEASGFEESRDCIIDLTQVLI